MSFSSHNKQNKEFGPKTKNEKRMELICGIVAMVLMVSLIIIIITASMTGSKDQTIGDKPWAIISISVFGGLILICLIVYIILKVQFRKRRIIEEAKIPTKETI